MYLSLFHVLVRACFCMELFLSRFSPLLIDWFLMCWSYIGKTSVCGLTKRSPTWTALWVYKKFRQARSYYFRDKCVIFARNCKFANFTQYNLQYILCNSVHFAQETLYFTHKNAFSAQRFPKNA